MSTGVPPTPSVPPAPGGTGAVSGTGTVVQLPPAQDGALVQLQLQQTLKGIVMSRTAQGTVTLQTPLGPVSVQTGLTPPPGAQLTLVVQSMGPPVQVTIQPGAMPTTPQAAGNGSGAAAATGTPPQSVQTSLTQGSVLFATMTRPAGTPAAAGGASAPTAALQPGTTRAGTTLSGAQTGALPAGSVQSGVAATSPMSPAVPPSPAALAALPAGSRIAMRIAGIQVPGGTATTAVPASSPGGAVPATVTGSGTGGQTLVQSPAGQMTLATSASLPQGTQLRLEPVGLPQMPTASAATDEAAGQRWDTLRDAIQAIIKPGAGVGQTRMMQAIPQPTPQMPAAVIFFLQALRHGSMRAWVGDDAAETLGRQSKPLLDRLGAEFAQMQRQAGEPVSQDWRLFQIPLFADGEAERLKLYIRDRHSGQEQDEGEVEGDRFVVEANFTRLGPFQFDGLARNKRLDLVIRTLARLPEQMQNGIGVQFADTVTALGLTGTLTFQVTDRFEGPAGKPAPDANVGILV